MPSEDQQLNTNIDVLDLSDPKRPIKIAEKLNEIYEHDWTASMEALESMGVEEEDCIKILLQFLTVVFYPQILYCPFSNNVLISILP